MKGLSVRQPDAGLIADGVKTIETRTRPVKYRGPLVICASRTVSRERYNYLLARGWPMEVGCRWDKHGFPAGRVTLYFRGEKLLTGVALCVVDLAGCHRMTKADEKAACREYREGLWALVLANVRALHPFPVRGRLGLFEVALPGRSEECMKYTERERRLARGAILAGADFGKVCADVRGKGTRAGGR